MAGAEQPPAHCGPAAEADFCDNPRFSERLKDSIPAATLIAMRAVPGGGPDEILVVKRSRKLAFAGGMIAFPGGRIEAQDHELAKRFQAQVPTIAMAARIAALRETFEETGLLCGLTRPVAPEVIFNARRALLEGLPFGQLLADFDWQIEPSALVDFARWCPPEGIALPRRFDTRFYIARSSASAGHEVTPDGSESSAVFWAGAKDLIGRRDAGEIELAGPTRATLARLARFGSYAEAHADAEAFPVTEILPVLRVENGKQWAGIPEGHGYPSSGFQID